MKTVVIGGQEFGMGNLEHPEGLVGAPNIYGDSAETPMIPRAQWKPTSLKAWCSPIKNQSTTQACNPFSTVEIAEASRRMAGLADISLSPGWIFGNINGQQNRGTYLEDAINFLANVGTVPNNVVGDLDWQKTKWPPNAKEIAKAFRMLEWWWCPTVEHVASALQSGFMVNIGLPWYTAYNAVDGDGWVSTGGRLMGGHSVTACSLVYSSTKRAGSNWGFEESNHWTKEYGKEGFSTLPEATLGTSIGGFWAGRSMTDEGGGVPAPKP